MLKMGDCRDGCQKPHRNRIGMPSWWVRHLQVGMNEPSFSGARQARMKWHKKKTNVKNAHLLQHLYTTLPKQSPSLPKCLWNTNCLWYQLELRLAVIHIS